MNTNRYAKAPEHNSARAEVKVTDVCGFANVSKATLHCPKCGDHNLHQLGVTVNQRKGEDVPGRTVFLDHGEIYTTSEQDGFVGRRDCLAIEFSCEHCGDDRFFLRIAQHKGSTFVYWELPGGTS